MFKQLQYYLTLTGIMWYHFVHVSSILDNTVDDISVLSPRDRSGEPHN